MRTREELLARIAELEQLVHDLWNNPCKFPNCSIRTTACALADREHGVCTAGKRIMELGVLENVDRRNRQADRGMRRVGTDAAPSSSPTTPERKPDMEPGNLAFGNSRGEVPVERGWRQEVAEGALEAAGFDTYGIICDERLRRFVDPSGLSCDVQLVRIGDYELMPYFWGDADAHPDVAAYPNFIDHGHGFSVQWYKYPMRDAYANRKTDDAEWEAIWNSFAEYVRSRLDGIPAAGDGRGRDVDATPE